MFHPRVHGPTEVVVVARDRNVVEGHGHALQALGRFDVVVADRGRAVERLEGVVEKSIGGVDFFGLIPCGFLIKMGQEALEACDGLLFRCASFRRTVDHGGR